MHLLKEALEHLGWTAAVPVDLTTLAINDVVLDVPDDEGFDLTIRVAEGSAGVEDITAQVHVWIASQR